MISAKGRPYQVHVLRLLPGEDVRRSLESWCTEGSIEAACVVSAVGSVTHAHLRYGGRDEGTMTAGDLEVVALSGTLSRHGGHLHLAVSDAAGVTKGGHLLTGTLVRTTLEVVVQEIGGLRFVRRRDERTGFDELFPEALP
jgi:predicted DNA-binding protein with PD1-like motif